MGVTIREELNRGILIFDGAMGTMLQASGLKTGDLPELFNITHADIVVGIHNKYIDAGANIITTNTFGINEIKLKDTSYTVEEVIQAGVKNAKDARGDRNVYIALDIGPIGELLEPMGTLSFEDAYDIFKKQVIEGVKAGVDLFLIETMTDLYEVKAAVLAVKENSDLAVFTTMSYEENGRTFTGSNILAMVMVLEGLGVDALGINCSLGPREIEPLIDEMLSISKIPLMVQANAGLPAIVNGHTVFNISPEEFARYNVEFAKKGVRVLGGCCGTNPKHIEALVKGTKDIIPYKRELKRPSGVSSPRKAVIIDGIRVIGERINPTGKELFKEALKKGDIDYILREAISQADAGAEILDVNLGLPEIDEEETMVKVIKEIQSILDIPLQIDSTDPKVIESGLRVYNGKAIVNSVNGEDKVLDSILPMVKKYGASVIGLCLDEKGIPKTALERFNIAEKIVRRAEDYGIDREDVYIDCLTLTVAAQQDQVRETLKAIQLVKENLKVKTVLGVSNISFGLPNRDLMNKTFLGAALYAGLDLAIIDPLNKAMMDTIKASKLLWNQDQGGLDYLKSYENNRGKTSEKEEKIKENLGLFEIILNGIRDEAKEATVKLLRDMEALNIIEEYIVPALDLIGERYERGDIFLPQLIRSAETVKESFKILKEDIRQGTGLDISNGKIILASVKGDIHDIGKNIVKVLLESYNYEIIDMGKNVSAESIIEKAIAEDVKLIGLSALMTTTVKNMEEIIFKIKRMNPEIKVMVGGAVLNQEYADMIKADYYAPDGKHAVSIAREVFKN